MDKQATKTLNAVYLGSNLRLLRYPLSPNETLSGDQAMIDKLIAFGDLVVCQKSLSPTLSVDVLRVSEQGESKVSENTRWYLSRQKEKARLRAKVNQRRMDVDHYKHERNPFMGWKLRRDGGKVICTQCHAINKPCEHGEAFLRALPVDARPPRANASKTRWNAFLDRFLAR